MEDNTSQCARRSDAQLAASEQELREKEAFNFALFQYNPAATTVVDSGGRVMKSNLARRRSPVPLPELGAELYQDTSDEYDVRMRRLLMDCIQSGDVHEISEIRHGEHFEAVTMAPIPNGAVVITHDITDRKQAEADLVQAQKLAALGTMVSGVAHEVSNPNTIINLSTAALQKIVTALFPILDDHASSAGDFDVGAHTYSEIRRELPELIDTLRRASERIEILVNDLKDFARKEPEDLRAAFDVNAAVEATVTMLHAIVKKQTQRFDVSYGESLPPVYGNRHRLEQVVMNLVTNALEALSDTRQAVSVTTRHDRGDGTVVIEVSDEGAGMAEGDVARITDPFFTTKHDTGGTGLGLSISRKIIDSYGGTLTFSSTLGEGTTVTVKLPEARGDSGQPHTGTKR